MAMADTDKPEGTKDKKKSLLGATRVPLDAVLLVVVPFVIFVVLFMYVMGLLPPRPMTVKVVGAVPAEYAGEQVAGLEKESVIPSSVVAPDEIAPAGEIQAQAEPAPVRAEPADTISVDAGGRTSGEEMREETAPTPQGTEGGSSGESPGETSEVNEERIERIRQLAKVYEQMNASSVAAIVTTMNEDDAVDILSNMKPRNAAKVLASLAPEKAATLSLRLTE